jgi:general secretion pathway protein C
MKRLPVLLSFMIVLVLSASLAYWAMQLLKPPQRPMAPTPLVEAPAASLQAGAALFGGQTVAVAASNYRLTGVIAAGAGRGSAGRRSAAIMVIDGKAPQVVPVGHAVAPGVLLAQVHPKYVLLSEGGAIKRVELATDGSLKGTGTGTGLLMQPPAPIPGPTQVPAPPSVRMAEPGMVVQPGQ